MVSRVTSTNLEHINPHTYTEEVLFPFEPRAGQGPRSPIIKAVTTQTQISRARSVFYLYVTMIWTYPIQICGATRANSATTFEAKTTKHHICQPTTLLIDPPPRQVGMLSDEKTIVNGALMTHAANWTHVHTRCVHIVQRAARNRCIQQAGGVRMYALSLESRSRTLTHTSA